jgi:hypothetical protein
MIPDTEWTKIHVNFRPTKRKIIYIDIYYENNTYIIDFIRNSGKTGMYKIKGEDNYPYIRLHRIDKLIHSRKVDLNLRLFPNLIYIRLTPIKFSIEKIIKYFYYGMLILMILYWLGFLLSR